MYLIVHLISNAITDNEMKLFLDWAQVIGSLATAGTLMFAVHVHRKELRNREKSERAAELNEAIQQLQRNIGPEVLIENGDLANVKFDKFLFLLNQRRTFTSERLDEVQALRDYLQFRVLTKLFPDDLQKNLPDCDSSLALMFHNNLSNSIKVIADNALKSKKRREDFINDVCRCTIALCLDQAEPAEGGFEFIDSDNVVNINLLLKTLNFLHPQHSFYWNRHRLISSEQTPHDRLKESEAIELINILLRNQYYSICSFVIALLHTGENPVFKFESA